jgi:molybdopterin-binding protein
VGVRVLIDCGFPLVATVTPRSLHDLGLVEGHTVSAVFKATAVHVIAVAASLDTPTAPAL